MSENAEGSAWQLAAQDQPPRVTHITLEGASEGMVAINLEGFITLEVPYQVAEDVKEKALELANDRTLTAEDVKSRLIDYAAALMHTKNEGRDEIDLHMRTDAIQ